MFGGSRQSLPGPAAGLQPYFIRSSAAFSAFAAASLNLPSALRAVLLALVLALDAAFLTVDLALATVTDPATGTPIGALTVGVDAEALM